MLEEKNSQSLQTSVLVMRFLIGWHFLYEGVIKWYNPEWTSQGYLVSSNGFLKPFFRWLASDGMISIVDSANVLALILVGVLLVLGVYEKFAAIIGGGLLIFYYLAQPAFPWVNQINAEGNYWFVNKNLIELAALAVIYQLPTGMKVGLERLLKSKDNHTETSLS